MSSQDNNHPYSFRADADHSDYPDNVTSNDQLDIEGFNRLMYQGNQNNIGRTVSYAHAHEIANNNDDDHDDFSDVFSISSVHSSPSMSSMPSFPSYSSPQ